MTVTAASFRSAFPEFNDSVKFPDTQVNLWLTESLAAVPIGRLGARAPMAQMLFVAHNLALGAMEAAAVAMGAAPGGSASGPIASKGVGPVSVSYDTGSTADPRAGQWNSTSYGRRYWNMLKSVATFTYFPGNPRFQV